MRRIILFFFSLTISLRLLAVPATPAFTTRTLPDGSTVTYRMIGDEHAYYCVLPDGTPIRFLPDGTYIADPTVKAEARECRKQHLSDERRRQQATQQRRKAASVFPRKGEVRSVVILAAFADVDFTVSNPREAFTAMLNQDHYHDNYATGSARDYFLASSNGTFQPTFDVYGPYKLDHDCEYYGAHYGNANDRRAGDMIVQACRKAEADGVDFSLYDENNDGVIDNVFVYYAGHNEAEHGGENTIWPHKSSISSRPQLSGKELYTYSCTSELKGESGITMCGIGTFCHEFGHVLGLPDFYNTSDSDEDTYTVGNWDIMAYGSYNNDGRTPPVYGAFERFMLDWLQPIQLDTAGSYRLRPLETSNTAYLIAQTEHNLQATTPSPAEYFLVENRQYVGWDSVRSHRVNEAAIPGEGLLITHITYNNTTWLNNTFNNSTPLGYDVVEAYGSNHSASSSADTYPGSAHITHRTLRLNTGTELTTQQLFNIFQSADQDVVFSYGEDTGIGFSFSPAELPTLITTYDSRAVEFIVDSVSVIGSELDSKNVEISIYSGNFEFSPDRGVKWYQKGTTFTDTCDEQRQYLRTLYLRYAPTRQRCDTLLGALMVRNDNAQSNILSLTGSSPRPTYITQPKITEVSNVTPYSMTLTWEEVDDAESYFLTLYSLSEGQTTISQGFENFANMGTLRQQGWLSNKAQTSNTEKKEGSYSYFMTDDGQYLLSEKYIIPAASLSFWVSANYTDLDAGAVGGVVYIYGIDTLGQKTLVDSITMRITTRSLTKTYELTNSPLVQFEIVYHKREGNGGVLLDAWNVTLPKAVNYVYQQREREIIAPGHKAIVNSLESLTTYYAIVQAYESKGCRENITDLDNPYSIRTLPGNDNRQLTIVRQADGTPVAYLPEIGDANKVLNIYNTSGQLVLTINITAAQTTIPIPQDKLQAGQLYIVKYTSPTRMRRKDVWGKFSL